MHKLIDFIHSERGSVVVSVLMGVGLATLFRQTCKRNCVVVRAPSLDELRNHVYDMDGTCYQYTPRAVPCHGSHAISGQNTSSPTASSAPPPRA